MNKLCWRYLKCFHFFEIIKELVCLKYDQKDMLSHLSHVTTASLAFAGALASTHWGLNKVFGSTWLRIMSKQQRVKMNQTPVLFNENLNTFHVSFAFLSFRWISTPRPTEKRTSWRRRLSEHLKKTAHCRIHFGWGAAACDQALSQGWWFPGQGLVETSIFFPLAKTCFDIWFGFVLLIFFFLISFVWLVCSGEKSLDSQEGRLALSRVHGQQPSDPMDEELPPHRSSCRFFLQRNVQNLHDIPLQLYHLNLITHIFKVIFFLQAMTATYRELMREEQMELDQAMLGFLLFGFVRAICKCFLMPSMGFTSCFWRIEIGAPKLLLQKEQHSATQLGRLWRIRTVASWHMCATSDRWAKHRLVGGFVANFSCKALLLMLI